MRQLTLFCLLISTALHAQVYQNAENAFTRKDYATYAPLGEQLLQWTRHPNTLYRLGEAYAALGQTEKAISVLDELATRGGAVDPMKNTVLAKFRADPAYAVVFGKFAANNRKINNSTPAFTLAEKQLIPEGIAVDPGTGDFYISSLAQWKVVKRTGKGAVSDFVKAGQDGIWLTLGMKVDPTGKQLWVCSASEYDTLNGYAGIFVFDLSTGALVRKVVADNKTEHHLFNDLVIDKQGNAYFTDSKPGKLYKLPAGSDNLEQLSDAFIYPNGIAFDATEQNLYIADYTGLTRLHVATNNYTKVDDRGITFLHGIDGLMFYENSLIAIQDSGNNDDRVARFYLDTTGGAVQKVEVLQSYHADFATPTTGTIYKDHYYYIANSFLRHLQPDRSINNQDQLKSPLILKLPLK